MKFILLVLILAIIAAVYLYIENHFILAKRHEDFGGDVKILHISDCHKRNNSIYNKRILSAAQQEKPDLIFITGDFVSRTETDFSLCEAFLHGLCEIAPVYLCMGNHEQSFIHDNQQEFLDAMHRTNAEILINSGRHVKIKGREFYICGVMPEYFVYKKDSGYKNLDDFTLDDMKKNLGDCPMGEVLLLAHNPIFGAVYADWGADYTFSGHIHGGVVRLFGVGILSPERKFFPKYSKGIYDISGKKLLVSAGVGKLRMFNPPEIITYKL